MTTATTNTTGPKRGTEETMMTRQEELRKMVAEATPGPWETAVENREDLGCDHIWIAPESWLPRVARVVVYPEFAAQERANAALIAQAPTLATDLADALDREAAALVREAALREAIGGLGAMPEGYCFCSKDRIGDDSKTHEPECADLRALMEGH